LLVVAVLLLGAAVFLALLDAGLRPSVVCLILGLAIGLVGGIAGMVARSMGMGRR
jgi:hypothetical protein